MQFHEILFTQRTLEKHIEYIELINESAVHSVTYGINGSSPLLQLPSFNITECLPFDIMHTIFEGVVPHHLNLLLHYLLDEKKYLTLCQLNEAIKVHHYGYTEMDTRPNPINRGTTTGSDFRIKSSGQ